MPPPEEECQKGEERRGGIKDEGDAAKTQAPKRLTSLIDAPADTHELCNFIFKKITNTTHWERMERNHYLQTGTFVKCTKSLIINPHKQITHE